MKGLECRGGGKAARETERERDCPRQRDIVQIAESGDIDHRGASAAEPLGTDTSDLAIPLQPPSVRPPLLSLCSIVRRRVVLEAVYTTW